MAGGDGAKASFVVFCLLMLSPAARGANLCPHATPDHNGNTCYDTPTADIQNCDVLVNNNLCNGCDSGDYFGTMAGAACCLSCSMLHAP